MELDATHFNYLRDYVLDKAGLVIPESKEYLILHRLEPLIKSNGMVSFAELCTKLREGDMHMGEKVVSAMTTNETFFFRDEHPFEAFVEKIMPELKAAIIQRRINSQRKGCKVRIWCAASSTGQEPYSISMLIDEYVRRNPELSLEDFAILATDIDANVLAHAMRGNYTDYELSRGLSDERKGRYFVKAGNSWQINEQVQGIVEFRRLNLMERFGHLGGFDVVFCRNVLIYFTDEAKRNILEQCHSLLSPVGCLILGSSENLYSLDLKFKMEKVSGSLLYRKE